VNPPALQARDVTIRFGACVANDGAAITVKQGSIHALVGENGAGKSTLCKTLFGMLRPDTGEVLYGGKTVILRSPRDAMALGVGMVHQHFMLVNSLTVAENVALGAEPSRGGMLDSARMRDDVIQLSRRFGLEVEPDALVADLPVGVQQRVEILKALRSGAQTLILDEPTAVLTPPEVDGLFVVLRALKAEGRTILMVTHKLPEVLAICDSITVMRHGKTVAEKDAPLGTVGSISELMVGRAVDLARKQRKGDAAEVRLSVDKLQVQGADGRLRVQGISLSIRAGEVVGIAGVEGNGQTDLANALSGVTAPSDGSVILLGQDVTAADVRSRMRMGLAHVPEDRLQEGLAPSLGVEENSVLGGHDTEPMASWGWLHPKAIAQRARDIIARLDVRPTDASVPINALSGGNQQKVLVGRELASHPKVLILAQPTRGVDVGAMEKIHAEILAARDAGCAVLLFSAELPELMALSDVIHVMYRGKIVFSTPGAEATPETLGPWMLGGTR